MGKDESEIESSEIIKFVESVLQSGDNFVSDSVIPLAMGQADTYERMYLHLKKYVTQPDVQNVLDDLRHELYSGVKAPPLKELHSASLNCTKCADVIEPGTQTLPKWNVKDPDLLIVVDTPYFSDEASKVLVETLKNTGFQSSRVGLTYINRCLVGRGQKFSAQHIANCTRYLFPEIQILKPKLIMPLGLIPYVVFFGDSKISTVRGELLWLGSFPFITTYAPQYVAMRMDSLEKQFHTDFLTAHEFCYGKVN